MTFEELLETKTTVEIDDIHNARAVVSETANYQRELVMFRTAEILANLRDYYVKIGRELERLALAS